jgi:hypothetical protein
MCKKSFRLARDPDGTGTEGQRLIEAFETLRSGLAVSVACPAIEALDGTGRKVSLAPGTDDLHEIDLTQYELRGESARASCASPSSFTIFRMGSSA